jgi:hypothetical protein
MITRLSIAIAGAAILVTAASAADPKKPTVEALEQLIGDRLSKMVPALGPPNDVNAFRGDAADGSNDSVSFSYDGFQVMVDSQTILGVLFTSDWKSPVEGVTIGQSIDDVIKKLGSDFKTDDAKGYYEWKLPKIKAVLDIYPDSKKKTVDRILIIMQ